MRQIKFDKLIVNNTKLCIVVITSDEQRVVDCTITVRDIYFGKNYFQPIRVNAKAICDPSDTFNEEDGIAIAYEKAMEKVYLKMADQMIKMENEFRKMVKEVRASADVRLAKVIRRYKKKGYIK